MAGSRRATARSLCSACSGLDSWDTREPTTATASAASSSRADTAEPPLISWQCVLSSCRTALSDGMASLVNVDCNKHQKKRLVKTYAHETEVVLLKEYEWKLLHYWRRAQQPPCPERRVPKRVAGRAARAPRGTRSSAARPPARAGRPHPWRRCPRCWQRLLVPSRVTHPAWKNTCLTYVNGYSTRIYYCNF